MEVDRDKLLEIIITLENHRTHENNDWLRLVLKDLYNLNKGIEESVDAMERFEYGESE